MQITNNVFIVTGGASGLGGAVTRMIVSNGGHVVIADVQADKGECACCANSAQKRVRPMRRHE